MAARPRRAAPCPDGDVLKVQFSADPVAVERKILVNDVEHFLASYDNKGRLVRLKVLCPTSATERDAKPELSYERAWLHNEYSKSVEWADEESKRKYIDRVESQFSIYMAYYVGTVLCLVVAALCFFSQTLLDQQKPSNPNPAVVAFGIVLSVVAVFLYAFYRYEHHWDRAWEYWALRTAR
jgi:hypothetical protein